ncbi:MAG TPA: L-threonylcarbamoyladenylate synthase [Candidatus Saccharimonadales bacterium]|jgi:tRNA threonylcarbamoyl adenosine modification protein (Sua5/YciO/YrdC/YwlC family)
MKVSHSLQDEPLVAAIKNGAVGVLPTDTIYGLAAVAGNTLAVSRLYALKSREHKPGTVIAASIDQLVDLGIKRRYLKAVEQFWPGAVSVIIPTGDELDYLRQGVPGLAIRIPADETLRRLLEQTGPLLTSSANQPGEPPANNIAEAQKYFGGQVDFYVDGDDLSGRPPSTIIRIVDDAIEVLRQGAVKIP